MKIILSRKGFDSGSGGLASPIFEDGTMISLPIPYDDKDNYNDLVYKGKSYANILKDLKYKGKMTCHLDPDLDYERRIQPIDSWKPIFGQDGSAASYLLNTVNIEVGDLFLFFGNFHAVKEVDGKISYIRNTKDFYKDNDLQVIWGYLQVGDIVTDIEMLRLYNWHPHSVESNKSRKPNVMFIASENLSFNSSMRGSGLLKFDTKRVLTLDGASKASWKKNLIYDLNSIVGKRKNSSNFENGLYYKGQWQELGLKETDECEVWAKNIILS